MNSLSATESQIRILGINSGLAKVVWLEIDGGEAVAYGVNCAAKAKFGRPGRKGDDMTFSRMSRPFVPRVKQVCVQPPSL